MADYYRRRPSARQKKRAAIRRRKIGFTIAVILLLAFLVWYLVKYLPERDAKTPDANSPAASGPESGSSGTDGPAHSTGTVPEQSAAPEISRTDSSVGENSYWIDDPSTSNEADPSSTEENSVNQDPTSGQGYVITEPDEENWNLILVNKTHRLAENLEIETRSFGNEEVDARIYDSLKQMLEDGERDSDREFLVCSGYRSVDLQQYLFDNKIQRVRDADPALSYDEAYNVAATEVAIPGASEHNTGLAVDICAIDFQMLIEEYEETDEAQWLKENCYKYGFILRYPKDKQDVTQIIYEPWHFRYVGVEAATEIMSQGITLEEYLGKVD